MTFSYLITTIDKTEDEILSIVSKSNIKGTILIGNQNSEKYSAKTIKNQDNETYIFNLTGKGVSKNRNFLLSKATSDYVVFLDDDVSFLDNAQVCIEQKINNASSEYFAYRFNSLSNNNERPIKQIKKNGCVSFFQLRNFGVWGIFFNRLFLIKNNLIFDEDVGPGTSINHGEDFLFIRDFLKKNKIYQFNDCGFLIEQNDSTWTGQNRDFVRELFSHGFLYKRAFGIFWHLFLFIHFSKHKALYQNCRKQKYQICKKGAKFYSIIRKNKNIDRLSLYDNLTKRFYE